MVSGIVSREKRNKPRMDLQILDHIQRGSVYALIPARSGSKGIKDKNLRCVADYPLLAYAVAVAKLANTIDRVIVSTDSPRYAEIARYYGAETPFLRPEIYSRDTSEDFEFIMHALNWFHEKEGKVPELIAQIRPTVPFRSSSVIDEAVEAMLRDTSADSLQSARRCDWVPYKTFTRDKAGYYHPLVPGMDLDDVNRSRHTFPTAYMADGYVDVLRIESIVKTNSLHGSRMVGFVTPFSVDIDTEDDLIKADELIRDNNSPLTTYLRENYLPMCEMGVSEDVGH